jgi:hypothetical protein
MKHKALVQMPENIAHFLKHLGEPTCPPPLPPRSCSNQSTCCLTARVGCGSDSTVALPTVR